MDMPEKAAPAQWARDLVWAFFATEKALRSFMENESRLTPLSQNTLVADGFRIRVVVIGESHYVVVNDESTRAWRFVELLACVDPAGMGFQPDVSGKMIFSWFASRIPGVATDIEISRRPIRDKNTIRDQHQLDPDYRGKTITAQYAFSDPYEGPADRMTMCPQTLVHVGSTPHGGIQIVSVHEYALDDPGGNYDVVLHKTTIDLPMLKRASTLHGQ